MAANENNQTVGILGAGTMGAGIAQVAAMHGWAVHLMDVNPEIAARAIHTIRQQLDRLVEKGKIAPERRDDAISRLVAATSPREMAGASLIIEAVVEDLDAKVDALMPVIRAARLDAAIASNTSSLSIARLGESLGQPRRTVGMHFFNPAPILPLVEIISGTKSDPSVVDRVFEIARSWGKTAVRAKDTPGFIVNRIARPYYLEAWRILEDGYADAATIDGAMRKLGGFKMGPLELTDMIGQDVNTATTRSVWEQLGKPARLAPSVAQEGLVAQGHLGRKTGRGAYSHAAQPPVPAVQIAPRPLPSAPPLWNAVNEFVARATDVRGEPAEQYAFARVLVGVIDEARRARDEGVAKAGDIDTALKLATSYPRGPLEWAEQIGWSACDALIDHLGRGGKIAGGLR
jgi:3-hydroxybutyryl-CoA dehydrogenase